MRANGSLPPGTQFQRATGTFEPTLGAHTGGSATLEEITSGVRIQVTVHDAKPNAKLGVHVVDASDCAAPAGGTSTPHFNPRGTQHGLPSSNEQHLGDLGNLVTDERGSGELLITTSGGNLRPADARSFLEHAIVVDDREDQGTTAAATPTACAVIKAG
jgi:Cu-Zn family superoxide dismutase